MATGRGYDLDNPRVVGDVGKAGANCVQLVASTLADGIEYIKAAICAVLTMLSSAPGQ
ncbi:MAG: hypothetical protein H6R25_1322 [Proteobacteria bacterium]|nr:hypothetical protein [Pseudomonadota bacterium]